MLLHLSSALGELQKASRHQYADTPPSVGLLKFDMTFLCAVKSHDFFLYGWLGYVGFNRLFEKKCPAIENWIGGSMFKFRGVA